MLLFLESGEVSAVSLSFPLELWRLPGEALGQRPLACPQVLTALPAFSLQSQRVKEGARVLLVFSPHSFLFTPPLPDAS